MGRPLAKAVLRGRAEDLEVLGGVTADVRDAANAPSLETEVVEPQEGEERFAAEIVAE